MNSTLSEMLRKPPWKKGATSDIYELPGNKVLKLFHSRITTEAIYGELWATQVAYKAGLNVPKVDQKVFVEKNRYGLTFDRVSGVTFSHLYMESPHKVVTHARILAEELFQIHIQRMDESLPKQEEIWAEILQKPSPLPDAVRSKLLDILLQLPSSNHLCHGDYHLENLLISDQQRKIIDWCDASVGNPLGDLATSVLILKVVGYISVAESALLKYFCVLNNYLFLQHYQKLAKQHARKTGDRAQLLDKKQFASWMCLAAAKRIALNNEKEVPVLLRFIDNHKHVYR